MTKGPTATAGCLVALLLALTVGGATAIAADELSYDLSYESVRATFRGSELRVLDREGAVLHEKRVDRSGRRLAWVPLADVSPALRAAVIRAEDKRFYSHGGVDWRAAGAAAWRRLRGGSLRGASTIPMQLAGMLHPGLRRRGGPRGWGQKWRQASEAWELERSWTKDQLLEAYLNLVAFRGELRGVAAATRGLFGKDPHGVTETEAAVLAALLRSPNAEPGAVRRRACGLARAVRPAYDCAPVEEVVTAALGHPPSIAPRTALAPHVAQRLGRGTSATTVASTLDAGLQRFATESLAMQLRGLAGRNVQDGAALVVDNGTGEVLAYVGNVPGISPQFHVDGVTALRQAGSTLKPFLYGLAMERRLLTAASLLDDRPLDVPVARGVYRPENYDHRYHGLVPLRAALASSLNVPAVRTLLLVGVEPFVERLRALGFRRLEAPDFYGPSLALGSADVSLWDLVGAYRALANGGAWSPLRLERAAVGPPEAGRRVLSPEAAFLVGDILSDRSSRALTFGLESALSTRFWSAVKTGTSKDMRDNWCVGSSARYTVGVWTGNFSGEPMWDVSGTSGAAPVWVEIMKRLHERVPSPPPVPPGGVVRRRVDVAGARREEWFLAGTESDRVVAGAAARPARIVYPTAEMVVAMDPDIPRDRQALLLEAETGGRALRWQLDGRDLGPGARPVRWALAPGRHRLALKDPAGGETDALRFSVRGAFGKDGVDGDTLDGAGTEGP